MTPDQSALPTVSHGIATVRENVAIARDTYRLRLECPLIAGSIRPGQFVMIRTGAEGSEDPLLGRPFALYDVIDEEGTSPRALDVVYLVVGRGTGALSRRKPGERLPVWGPLGNGFGPPPEGPALFVAGGIGQTPFLALGRSWLGKRGYGGEACVSESPCASVSLLYGVRDASFLAGVEDFSRAGMAVEVATDNGSAGHQGLVTDLLSGRLARGERPALIVACGPAPMLAAVARIASEAGVACQVSLENHMACGFGVCFSCVAPIRQPDGTSDLRRVCVEGPVFDAAAVAWNGQGDH